MKFAVIKTGGKQYKVHEGDKLKVEKLEEEVGKNVVFDQVLLISDQTGENLTIGTPLTGTSIQAKVLKQGRGDKVLVRHYKAKVRYSKVYGHRQSFTEVQIEKIA